ncbi:hypothetical protein SVAN01_00844 [Stagonosporopsis vannaccii]|nr:hypothetical protein SVAN01_00844 [Stagonosporopsis vannaccii]
MTSSTKKSRSRRASGSCLKISPPRPEALPNIIKPSPKPRLRINLPCLDTSLPKIPLKETSSPDLGEEIVSSDGTLSRPASPASCVTLSAVASDGEDEVYEEDELYRAATILFRMAHSKQHKLQVVKK